MSTARSGDGRAFRCGQLERALLALWIIGATSACVSHPGPSVPPSTRTIKEVPAGARLVAAGVLKGDMTTRTNVQGDIRITRVATGQMVVAFEGYHMPGKTGGPHYQLKAVASRTRDMVVPVVAVESYDPDGVILRITDPAGKMPLPLKYLVEHEFSIEVLEVHAK